MAQITPDPIMRIAMGFMAAKHLFVANEIGLFTGLAQGPATLHELAEICGIPRRTAGISADAMVSLGLLERDGDRYRNSDTAAAFLAGQPGPDLRPMLCFWNRISYPGWLALEDAVRAGAGQAKFGEFSAEEQQIFSAGVEAFSAATAASLAANYDFSRHRRLLDIGGGTGSFLLAVLRRHPALRGTLFELPGACEVARRRLAGEPEGVRIDVVEGDSAGTGTQPCVLFIQMNVLGRSQLVSYVTPNQITRQHRQAISKGGTEGSQTHRWREVDALRKRREDN